MIKLNTSKILVPFDFSLTAKKAIQHAAMLVKANKGELQLLYVSMPKSLINIGLSIKELRQMSEEKKGYEKQMEETASEIKKEYDIPVRVLVKTGRHISGVIKFCEKNHIGLIVMGTEGFESVSNLLTGSNSHKIVSRSTIPVITVRSESHVPGYSTIVVPIDLSEHTRQKMIIAIRLAKLFSAKIELLALLTREDSDDHMRLWQIVNQIEKRLKEEKIVYGSELIKTEHPARATIANAQRKKADLIITMTDQESGSSYLISRPYDRELVDDSDIPVLSIPPEIHEENIAPASIGGLW